MQLSELDDLSYWLKEYEKKFPNSEAARALRSELDRKIEDQVKSQIL